MFIQKTYLRRNYLESNIEEDIDLKDQYRIKNLPDPSSIRETASKSYVDIKFNSSNILKNTKDIDLHDKIYTNVRFKEVNRLPEFGDQLTSKLQVDNVIRNIVDESSLLRLGPDEKLKLDEQNSILPNATLTSPKTVKELPPKSYIDNLFNDPSIIKNTAHVDFNDKSLYKVRFIEVNSMPAVGVQLIAKHYVDHAFSYKVDESSLLKLDPNEKLKLHEQDSKVLNSTLTSPKTKIELPTKSYVDSSHESSRNRRNLSSLFNDQDIEFDNNKLTNLDSVTVNRNPISDNEMVKKKYIADSLGESTLVRFNQSLQIFLKVSVGNYVYNLTKYGKIQITDTTIFIYPNTGGYLLQNWAIKRNDKNNSCKIQSFIKSTNANSPTGYPGATSLTPIGNSFLYRDII